MVKLTTMTKEKFRPTPNNKYAILIPHMLREDLGSVALLSHFEKVLLSKFILLNCEIYSYALEPHSTDSLGH